MKSLIFLFFFVVQVVFSQSARPFFSSLAEKPLQNSTEMTFREMEITTNDGRKSVAAATALSLLVPGLGEWYVGDYSTGKYFSIAEGTLWLTWSSFRVYGDWIQNDARQFSSQHAGVSLSNKDDQYFIDIGNFVSVDEFNEQVLRDRDEEKIYNPYSDDRWEWDSDVNREQYRQLRVQSDKVHNNANFVIAAIVVNHVVSAINAARTAVKHNDALSNTGGLSIQASPLGTLSSPNGIMLSATYEF